MERTARAGQVLVPACRGIARATALLLAGVLLLFSAPTADAAVEGPKLDLSRDAGPTGTTVGWDASGFDDCKAFGDEGSAPVASVELRWDDEEEAIDTAEVEGGLAASDLEIPGSAKPGLHLLTASCAGVSSVAQRPFRVLEPTVEPPTPVDTAPDPDPDPPPDPDPGDPSPDLVAVPRVVNGSLVEAQEALRARGLKLGRVVGDPEGIVHTQRPRAGQEVRRGTAVRVTMVAKPLPLVRVPDVVGTTSTEADATLRQAGLVLSHVADDDREISSQDPVAGAVVPAGSTVRVVYSAPGGRRSLGVVLAAVLLGLVAGMVALRGLKRRLDQRWVDLHDVRAEPGKQPDPAEVVEMADDEAAPTLTVRIEPHPDDSGSHVLEEMNRP